MKTKDAIKVYERYIEEIRFLDIDNCEIWHSKVLDTTKLYIGEESELYKKLRVFSFTQTKIVREKEDAPDVKYIGFKLGWDTQAMFFNRDGEKTKAKDLLKNCIDYIKDHGLINKNENQKGKFYEFFSSGLGIAISIITILGAGYGAGYYLGTQKIDADKIKLEQKVTDLTKVNETLKRTNNSLLNSHNTK